MGIVNTVVEVAEILDRSGLVVEPNQRAATGLLRSIPLFSETAKIEVWERSLGELLPEEPWRPEDLVIDKAFAFAQFNLYGTLDPGGTEACFRELEKAMRGAGLPVPNTPDFSQW